MALDPVITEEVVIQFPNIIEPNPEDAEVHPGKWTLTAWFDKAGKMKELFETQFDLAVKEKWDKKPKGKFRELDILDGDDESQSYENDDGEEVYPHKGMWGIRMNTQRKPAVFDKYGNRVTEQKVLGFAPKGNIKFHPWPYDNKFGKGVSMTLDGVKITDFGASGGESNGDGFDFEDPQDEDAA